VEADGFDWETFFSDGVAPQAGETTDRGSWLTAEEPPASEAEPDEFEEEDRVAALERQIAELKNTVVATSETTSEIAFRDKKREAIDSWKRTASPEALTMSELLEEATTPEEIKSRAKVIETATKMLNENMEAIEQRVQRKFGLPVQPTFSPIPEKERVDNMLENGDIDGAASALLKGVFNT